jgi:predicted ATPase
MAQQGDLDEGIAHMREGLAANSATGAEMGSPYFQALLGEALGNAGRPDDGLQQVEIALASARDKGAGFQISEMLRLKGELLLLHSTAAASEARECFHAAIAAAREQGAHLPRLRAAASLARLLQRHGEPAQALKVLQSAYAVITEGRETADLREAAALLDELRQA